MLTLINRLSEFEHAVSGTKETNVAPATEKDANEINGWNIEPFDKQSAIEHIENLIAQLESAKSELMGNSCKVFLNPTGNQLQISRDELDEYLDKNNADYEQKDDGYLVTGPQPFLDCLNEARDTLSFPFYDMCD